MHFKFQRADAVRDAFDVIAQAMREIIHRINAPFRAGVMMFGVADAIKHRVAQPDVRRRHVNLRAQRARAVGKFAGLHAAEQIEIFFRRAIAERRIFSRTIRRAAIKFHVRRRQIADEGLARFDQLLRVIVNLVEIIARVKRFERSFVGVPHVRSRRRDAGPEIAEDKNRVCRRRRLFRAFCLLSLRPSSSSAQPAMSQFTSAMIESTYSTSSFVGIRVVHAQIADAAELARDAEIQADAFRVADVQITVRLRRKAGVDARIFLPGDVCGHDVADEIRRRRRGFFVFQTHKIF